MTRHLSHSVAVAAALLVTVLWSSSWVIIRFGLDDELLEPLTFAGLRYGLASLVLIAWVAPRRTVRAAIPRLETGDWGRLVVLGILFYAVTQGAQFIAIDSQPAATSSLVLSWTPLLVAVVASRTISEQASRRQILGGVLVVAGAWAYFAGSLGATVVGMVAAVIGLGANAASAVLGRRVNRDGSIGPALITTVSMSVGAVVLLVVGIAVEGVPTVSVRGWALIGWLAVVNTALAFSLWNLSLRRLSAVESAGINNTMLIQIGFMAWLLLDEPLGGPELVGIVLVSLGVFLTQAIGRSSES